MMRFRWITAVLLLGALGSGRAAEEQARMHWGELPPVPDEIGFAGPFTGLSHDALIVAGGANFAKPFKIQEAALPLILDGFKKTPVRENLLAQAKSGSGKTAAFALGMLQNVDLTKPHVQGLCVCPTRELATQNAAVVRLIGKTLVEEKGLVVALALASVAVSIALQAPGWLYPTSTIRHLQHPSLHPTHCCTTVLPSLDTSPQGPGPALTRADHTG